MRTTLHAVALPANRVDGQHNGVKTMEIMTFRHSGVNTALALLSVAILAWTHPAAAAEPAHHRPGDDAEARLIVEKADQVRFPAEGFQVDVAITTTGSGQDRRRAQVPRACPRATPTASSWSPNPLPSVARSC
jgi:hypothetical protein